MGTPWCRERREPEVPEKEEDLKRREQEMTKELSHITAKIMEQVRKDFGKLIKGELEAIGMYECAVSRYGRFGWREIFSEILKDEYEHLNKLKICLDSIEEVYKREGKIKST